MLSLATDVAVKTALHNGFLKASVFNRNYALGSFRPHPLKCIFSPSSVALIGATDRPRTVGKTVLSNLLNNPFGGPVYPISLNSKSILGVKAYKSVSKAPEVPDLAVIVTPSKAVPQVIEECVSVGVKGAIIISAGFKEVGPDGEKLQNQVADIARNKLRIIGPNCLGIINPMSGINATFSQSMAKAGNLGFISQSGAFCTAVLDWSLKNNVGFSSFISVGGMMDVDWGDLIYYLGDDPHTQSILMYMESLGNARSFISAAREVSLSKPIIVIKGGRTAGAASAASSHTGALAGSDEVVDAAFRRCGVLRVNQVAELFNVALAMAKQPHAKGSRLLIMTNAGGPGVLSADGLIMGGGELAPLADDTRKELDAILPPHWSHGNPVDILGDASPEQYAKSFRSVVKNKGKDGTLVILTPQAMTEPTRTAEEIAKIYNEEVRKNQDGPVFTAFMGGNSVANANEILSKAGIPTFLYPDTAANVFNYMWKYAANLEHIYETPKMTDDVSNNEAQGKATRLIESIRKEGRTTLTEYEAKVIFDLYGIPTIQTVLAHNEVEAARAADQMGYPVVVKLNSKTITHKSDVGGVKLNLNNAEAVKKAFLDIQSRIKPPDYEGVTVQKMANLGSGLELIVGSSIDPQVGPVLLFGTGGTMVEVYRDSALGLPPLNTTLARNVIERTKVYKALMGFRGKQTDIDQLATVLVRCSNLIVQQPLIETFDINPLLATSNSVIALDARIILHNPSIPVDQLPVPAIRPYPTQYVQSWTLPDGNNCVIRPILPEDEPLMVEFNSGLSADSIYLRYFHHVTKAQLISHQQLARMCFIDYDREISLVIDATVGGKKKIIGLGQFTKVNGMPDEAEFAVLVADGYQRKGIGKKILDELVVVGRKEGLSRIIGQISSANVGMKAVAVKCGFALSSDADAGVFQAELKL